MGFTPQKGRSTPGGSSYHSGLKQVMPPGSAFDLRPSLPSPAAALPPSAILVSGRSLQQSPSGPPTLAPLPAFEALQASVASLAPMPPSPFTPTPVSVGPLCPALVPANAEATLTLSRDAFLAAEEGGEVRIFGPLKAWGLVAIAMDENQSILEIYYNTLSGEGNCVARLVGRSPGELVVHTPDDEVFAVVLRLRDDVHEVRRRPEDETPLVVIAGDPTKFRLTASGSRGEWLASVVCTSEQLEVRIQRGADTALLLSSLLGVMILL